MDTIFHEKQEGQLCAQHCLNALLQGPFYTAVDLASLAQQLDDDERRQMAEGQGVDSDEYRRFLEQPSGNMDDTGFFSVQVIARAIGVWGLELVSFSSSDARAVMAKINPTTQKAFICNYREHWFTIRKLGNQWFNLNSLLTGPELISDTFLGMFITQLEGEGYTVYVVMGDLPASTADEVLSVERVFQAQPPALIGEASRSGRRGAHASRPKMGRQEPDLADEDEELQRVLALSMQEGRSGQQQMDTHHSADDDLELALRLSQTMAERASSHFNPFPGFDVTGSMASGGMMVDDQSNIVSEEDELQKAIQMSLQGLDDSTQISSKDKPVEKNSAVPNAAGKVPEVKPSTSKTSSSSSTSKSSTASRTTAQPKPSTSQAPIASTPSSNSSPPIRPATSAIPGEMPGTGNRVGGESRAGVRETTPDPEEVRRRRLAFLEKMQK